jgi:hypothetical protein
MFEKPIKHAGEIDARASNKNIVSILNPKKERERDSESCNIDIWLRSNIFSFWVIK